MASLFFGAAGVAHADVFGAGGGAQTTALVERLNALEKELKELKERGPVSGPATPGAPGQSGKPGTPNLTMPPPPPLPGLEGLPGKGADEQEGLLVEKELTHEVVGTVNGLLLVRDGENRYVMSKKEFKEFETSRRKKVVKKLKVEAVSEASGGKLKLPQVLPTQAELTGASNTLNQASQAVDQARALEANGGKVNPAPAAPPAPAAAPAPAAKK